MSHRIVKLAFALFVPAAALQGCGASSSSSDLDEAAQPEVASFQEWCTAWGLTCPTTPPDNVPSADHPWSAAQWQSAFALVKATASSPGNVRITRAELDDQNLATALQHLGGAEMLAQLKQRLDASKVQSVGVTAGGFSLAASAPADFAAQSGLVVHNDVAVTARVTDAFDVAVTGLDVHGQTDAADALAGFGVTNVNVLDWRGPSTAVAGVPIKFAFQELAGVELGGDAPTAMPGYQQLQPAMMPLKDWITTGQRDVDLRREAFQAYAQHLPRLVDDQQMATALRYILERVKTVQSTAASRRQKLVQGEATGEIRCNAGDQAQIMIQPQFGITSLTRLSATSSQVALYGIKVKPLTGAIRPTITLNRIDFEPTRIVVRDVPIMGTYVIDMSDSSGGGMSMNLTCG